jgi:hypothetical protein
MAIAQTSPKHFRCFDLFRRHDTVQQSAAIPPIFQKNVI